MKRQERDRIEKLNAFIEDEYDLFPDEIDFGSTDFAKTITEMIEVIDVRPQASTFIDLFEDIEYSPVMVPKDLARLLRPHDVFLATLGYRNRKWKIIWLSPAYKECGLGDDFDMDTEKVDMQ